MVFFLCNNLIITNSIFSKTIPENNEFKTVAYYNNPFELSNKKQIRNKSKNIDTLYQNIYLLHNFHKTLIQLFLDFLIRNFILYGYFNVQRHSKSSEGQNEINASIRLFTGETYRLGTGHSRLQTQYYCAYFNPSTPGSIFTSQDFNIIKKFNGNLYLCLVKSSIYLTNLL